MKNIIEIILENRNGKRWFDKQLSGSQDYWARRDLADNVHLHPEHIDTLVNDSDEGVRQIIAKHPYLEDRHFEQLAFDVDTNVRSTLARHPKLPDQYMTALCHDPSSRVRAEIAEHPKLRPEHLEALLDDPKADISSTAAAHDNLSPDQLDHLINHRFDDFEFDLCRRTDLQPQHIDTILDKGSDPFGVEIAVSNHPITPNHIPKLIKFTDKTINKDGHSYVGNLLLGHLILKSPRLEPTQISEISKISKEAKSLVRKFRNPDGSIKNEKEHSKEVERLIKENYDVHAHLDQVLNSEHAQERARVADSPYLNSDHIKRMINDPSPRVRAAVARSRKLSTDHMMQLSNDHDHTVRRELVSFQSNLPTEAVEKLVTDSNEEVRHCLVSNVIKPSWPEHIMQVALSDPSERVRQALLLRDDLKIGHLKQLADDPSPSVSMYASVRRDAAIKKSTAALGHW